MFSSVLVCECECVSACLYAYLQEIDGYVAEVHREFEQKASGELSCLENTGRKSINTHMDMRAQTQRAHRYRKENKVIKVKQGRKPVPEWIFRLISTPIVALSTSSLTEPIMSQDRKI